MRQGCLESIHDLPRPALDWLRSAFQIFWVRNRFIRLAAVLDAGRIAVDQHGRCLKTSLRLNVKNSFSAHMVDVHPKQPPPNRSCGEFRCPITINVGLLNYHLLRWNQVVLLNSGPRTGAQGGHTEQQQDHANDFDFHRSSSFRLTNEFGHAKDMSAHRNVWHFFRHTSILAARSHLKQQL